MHRRAARLLLCCKWKVTAARSELLLRGSNEGKVDFDGWSECGGRFHAGPGELKLWFGWRQVSRLAFGGESVAPVGTVTKRLILGQTTAAEGNYCATGQSEGSAIGIRDFEVALNADRAVLQNGNFRC